MSKPDNLYRIRKRWWDQVFKLLDGIHDLADMCGSEPARIKAKEKKLVEQLMRLSTVFNSAWFQDPGILDTRPPARRRQPAKPKRDPKPAGKQPLRLVPPPTVH